MTQTDASYDVLTFRLLAELERGEGNPTLQTLFLLSKRLGVTVRDLVDVPGESPLKIPLREVPELLLQAPRPGRKPKSRRLPLRKPRKQLG